MYCNYHIGLLSDAFFIVACLAPRHRLVSLAQSFLTV